jgi:hypothetical protein
VHLSLNSQDKFKLKKIEFKMEERREKREIKNMHYKENKNIIK